MQLAPKLFLFFILAANSYGIYASPANTKITQTQNILPDYKAYYALKKAGITIAETVVEFSHDDSTFTYSSHSKTMGLAALFRDDQIFEKTTGNWSNGQIRPDTYSYQRTGKKKKTKNIDFNWKTNKATYQENDTKTTIELRKNSIDEFSNQLAMMLDLMKSQLTDDEKFSYPVVDDATLKERAFVIEGKEKITVKAGDFETIKIKRLRAEGNKRTTYFWCAKELYQLPVIIEHIESNGGKLSLELIKTEGI